ncbi:MAG: hypothetical protein HYS81_02430 [Candidatus Aenigmatarchaeota archaeon]|nr:MAG: hypothetical protein HYS81_02430 [Candidatus Aenigmarchaeota archaeon]
MTHHARYLFGGIDAALQKGLALKVRKVGNDLREAVLVSPNPRARTRVKAGARMPTVESALAAVSFDYLSWEGLRHPRYERGQEYASDPVDDWIMKGRHIFAEGGDNKVYLGIKYDATDKSVLPFVGESFPQAYDALMGALSSTEPIGDGGGGGG